MIVNPSDYQKFINGQFIPGPEDDLYLKDHLGGFDENLTNVLFEYIQENFKQHTVCSQLAIDQNLICRYPDIRFSHSLDLNHRINFRHFLDYRVHPEIDLKHFLCSFNGTPHVSRKLLVSILKRFGWFNPETCSKNFSYTLDGLDGHINDYVEGKFYNKFFIGKDSEVFFQAVYSFGHNRFDHSSNIYTLEKQLTSSFVHIVSECIATSYYPYVTEKFLYSVVTRGLFLAYAQPGWHDHLERYYGFRRYEKLFDYSFDTIRNPVERLIELMSMIAKFSALSTDDHRDLYHMESDTIEYNYDHYFSGDYLTQQ